MTFDPMAHDGDPGDDIAIVAMAGRFPGAANVDELWENLLAGREGIRHFTEEELREAGLWDLVRDVPGHVAARAILDEPEAFDAPFFGLSPSEANVTDPQHRVFLEVAWEALEAAGYDPRSCEEVIGVYAGVDVASYAAGRLPLWTHDLSTLIGNDKDYLASRVAYKLDLKGPAVVVQTACSTSLVAVHAACQALLGYQCDMALAGGVGIAFPQMGGYLFQEGGILSPDGHCRPFDVEARGTVGGDGCGIVVLKRLDDALADRDTIRAVIKAAAINNDGADKIGFTAPSVTGQAEVIAIAQELAGVHPDTIGYVEAHGTATQLGDPIEVAALTEVFRAKTDRTGFCALGSLKSNLGHMNSAAGIGGLIKAALCVERGRIPPSLHFRSPNPALDLESSPFFVPTAVTPWEPASHPRRAAVSSFGVGGTNAHAILEQAPPQEPGSGTRRLRPLFLSARSPEALDVATERLAAHLDAHPTAPLADVAYTLLAGRQRFEYRRLLFCADVEEARAALASPPPSLRVEASRRSVMFLLPGQGAQYPGMTRDLYRSETTYRAMVDDFSAYLLPLIGVDLRSLLLGDDAQAEVLNQTAHTQPALFVVEYALASLLGEWGVHPKALLGHSVGEYVAACLAGVFTPHEALDLLAARGRLIQEMPGGSMVSVSLPEEEARRIPGLEVAALNAPDSTVLSGPHQAVDEAIRTLEARGVACTRLHTSHAFHSAMMEPMLDRFRAVVERVDLQAPSVPFVSNVTGGWITDAEATDPRYWVQHIRRPVRFSDGVRRLLAEPDPLFVEVGPGRNLAGLVTRHQPNLRGRVVTTVRHPRQDDDDAEVVVRAVGRLHAEGADVDWAAVYRGEEPRRVPLPTYPFERRIYREEGRSRSLVSPATPPPSAAAQEGVWTPGWQRSVAPASDAPLRPGAVWVLTDTTGGADVVRDALGAPDGGVRAVRRGREWGREKDGAVILDPLDPDHWRRLFEEVPTDEPVRVVDLWPLEADGTFDGAQEAGLYPLLQLARAAGDRAVRIVVAARGTADVTGMDELDPHAAPLVAAARILSQEWAGLSCRVVDVADGNDVAHALRAEGRDDGDGPVHVAYRGGHRWTESFSPAGHGLPGAPTGLRERGVYLITGGLGEIGLSLSEHLAHRVGARLVLTGRSGLVAREEWDDWLRAHRDDDVQSRRIRRIVSMEEAGAEVEVMSADVADAERMRQVIGRTRDRFGSLHGVIHAAGLAGDRAFRAAVDTEPEHCRSHFRAKVLGTDVLADLLPRDLDFVLLLSSLSTAVGGAGLLAYAAANHYLDAVASRRRGGWVSVDLDAWASAAAGPLAGRGLSAADGARLIERIVSRPDVSRWIVSTAPLEQRRAEAVRRRDSGRARGSANEPAQRHPRPNLDTPHVPARDELEGAILSIWEEVLGIDGIGVDDSFFKLGGESLMAIQIGTRMRDGLGVEIPINELFEEATVAGAARAVRRRRREDGDGGAAEEGPAAVDHLSLVESLSDEEVRRMLEELEGDE